ncbi:hypothetical protein DENSPDRAFT_843534 [Dentipellis sp. KUC8613]|nr:hypothetical protein DENSPDRAFT_843534 [Dentipellis sp. KUC8613]
MASGPDASVPLLTPSPDMAMADPSASASASRSGDPDIELYDPWALVSDAEAGPSRAGPSRPPPSLRHAKNRIAHPPLETLPENGLAASSSSHSHSHSHSHTHTQASTPTTIRQQRPGGSSSTISRPEPSPAPSWLHIPRPGVPLIGAFRASVSSSTSSKSRSTDTLPSMQHYPSFTAQSAQSSDAPTTFYSLSSGEPGSSRRNGTGTGTGTGSTRLGAAATEYGELQRAAKLKASGGAGLVPEVHDGAGGLASRQASLMYGVGSDGGASEAGRAPASSRAGNVPGGYPTSASGGSSVSVYTDARSRPEEDEEAEERQRDAGRWSPLATWQSYWNFGSTAQR